MAPDRSTANNGAGLTSPCKGEVDQPKSDVSDFGNSRLAELGNTRVRQAGGRGSPFSPRFSRTQTMTTRARKLRRSLTDVERKLWHALRRDQLLGLSFRRQHPIGPYVPDFYCPAIQLAAELDGGQHAFASNQINDERRSRWLAEKGIKVIRFWNNDVTQNLDGVLNAIARVAQEISNRDLTPTPTLPLAGGGRQKQR
jgi:very-short-patch-repair endonuclease